MEINYFLCFLVTQFALASGEMYPRVSDHEIQKFEVATFTTCQEIE